MWREVTADQEGSNGANPAHPGTVGTQAGAEKQASHGLKNTVTEQAAQQGANHTKIPLVSLPGGAKDAGASGPSSAGPQPGAIPGAAPGNTVSLGELIEGKTAVELIDALIPSILVVGLYAIGMKLRKSELQLTDKEKNTVVPIFQKCLDSIQLNFDNPWVMLSITLGAIYGGKVIEKGGTEWIDKIAEKKAAKQAAKAAAAEARANAPVTSEPSMQDIATQGDGGYTEDEINRVRKKKKIGRDAAIKWLQNNKEKAA